VPAAERELLATLSGRDLHARLRALSDAGWSLSSLAEALDPPRPRTTIRSWITSLPPLPPPLQHQPSAPLKEHFQHSPPVPSPHAPPTSAHDTVSVRRFSSPRRSRMGIAQATAARLAELAPVARRHRPRTSPTNPARVANESLTRLTRELYSRGASIPELAEAAGVTYRAMRRRVRG
jgi:hypothetical protein